MSPTEESVVETWARSCAVSGVAGKVNNILENHNNYLTKGKIVGLQAKHVQKAENKIFLKNILI